jgi:predicted TIM-barrel fold metal-dependent hydrolase
MVELPAGTSRRDELGRTIDTPGTEGPLASYWALDGTFWVLTRQAAAAGYEGQVDSKPRLFEEVRPGCYDPKARLADMDVNGIEASLCFPNYPRFAGQRFSELDDKELGLLCVKAYNDWMVEEWAGQSGGRLIPLCIVPLWDPELAAAEVRRNAARGVTNVCFTELPSFLGLPSIYSGHWDPLFRACDEIKAVISMHIGSGTKSFVSSEDAPQMCVSTMRFVNSAASMVEYLTSGILGRFPSIRLYYAECQIGWIPYVLDRVEDSWHEMPYARGAAASGLPPSAYYKDRIFSCMFRDKVGARLIDLIGEDQVMFESDYPHGDGTWPNTRAHADKQLEGLPEPVQEKIRRGNAAALFGIE